MHGKPKHENRFRSLPVSQKETISRSQKAYERQNKPVKISLKTPPWFNQDQTTNQSPS